MRCLVGFVCVLAGLVASPPSVTAQGAEEDTSLERAEEPSSEPAPEEPALKLELDAAGVEVVPSPPQTDDGYTLEEMELRVKRPKIGIGVSAGALAAGMAMGLAVLGASMCPFVFPADTTCPPSWVDPVASRAWF